MLQEVQEERTASSTLTEKKKTSSPTGGRDLHTGDGPVTVAGRIESCLRSLSWSLW